jgi:hypothetical protein
MKNICIFASCFKIIQRFAFSATAILSAVCHLARMLSYLYQNYQNNQNFF